ncbi:bifunctional diaminohydroxyphosphoribosylaminopyrimidine deaminase/5-amino-6-(5-phosphoribosylamino)uracil reductase RibD [Sphingosinicella microcystinivorans]|uniref:bifunctional diaminohydroxyphosphoribosylaminopyrimidine deaminase/5-amino-6-(5-phosphoribosylamino)uracil reductase RibD n=1 Tax=Sphingosinicella microcystinivorans TaxID=335406 RepID=UPI0022F3B628|nr:bifunctional diaminohydroxyphosphoribosylaminopyrimidine deaminase/5-amino-6-(5-phosphoribosylamino)uracil reductase RibD [Sphingosinicella microcystinivorans]WBX82639.1 bifunctional diaminohydroxyphosphoribosylaminopyrimidine deaminase/5-amino-6-(5-phosphoribosylamino)uracil reductase RibD [Sphingosinicella microcystinivorans]
MSEAARLMDAAIRLSRRGLGRTAPNPNVGCLVVRDGIVVARGWTQPGGRPHAEAAALEAAGEGARGAALYVSLEPCAHVSARGPACADLIAASGVAAVHIAVPDPDPRTAGQGAARLRDAGIAVTVGTGEAAARDAMAGFFSRMERGRPRITLKLAMSIDGRVSMPGGESRWITGPEARAHVHLQRALADVIVVGRGTLEADDPSLDVRLPGLADRSPRPAVLSATLDAIPSSAKFAERDPLLLASTDELCEVIVNDVFVEGGPATASTLLAADLVDRILVYRAPIVIGDGAPGAGRIGLERLADAHGRWRITGSRTLGNDRLEVYERTR